LQNDDEKGMTCKICVEHYRDKLNLQGSSKKHLLREKKLISDKMSMSFSLSVREINSIKQVAVVILS
jgi:hypothetical protein